MLLRTLIIHTKILKDTIEKVLSKAIKHTKTEPICNHIKLGIFECCNGKYIVALYKVKYWTTDIHTLSQLDYIYSLKKFLDVFQIENCRSIFFTDIEPLDTSSHLSKLNNKLQMKLIELETDKTNVKLQNYVRRLIETRKKILIGIRPIRITNLVALVCNNNVNLKDLDKVMINAKNVLNIDLDPLIERKYAEVITNFC